MTCVATSVRDLAGGRHGDRWLRDRAFGSDLVSHHRTTRIDADADIHEPQHDCGSVGEFTADNSSLISPDN